MLPSFRSIVPITFDQDLRPKVVNGEGTNSALTSKSVTLPSIVVLRAKWLRIIGFGSILRADMELLRKQPQVKKTTCTGS